MATEDTQKTGFSGGRKRSRAVRGGGLRAGKPQHVCRLMETAMLCGKTGARKKGAIKGDGSG